MTTVEMLIERGTDDDWRELIVEVRGTVTRYRPATLADPADGGEVEIESVTYRGQDIELTLTERRKALGALYQQAHEDIKEGKLRRADYERDRRIDGF